jgi:hypothetical protein
MEEMELDSVFLQELMVKRWVRGNRESASVSSTIRRNHKLTISALGTSVGTGKKGISGKVIEVHSLADLATLGITNIQGKIVFFNRAMDPGLYNTYHAYGQAADQRVRGAAEAAKHGAIGVIVRSLTTALDDFPHTGVMYYEEGISKIPAVSVSTVDADLLSSLLKRDPTLNLTIISNCRNLEEVTSYNVVGEMKGSVYPEQIITVGGHLDAWDTGEGAHDDGAGCIQSIEVLRLFQVLGIQPKRTIRAVMFMDEEIAQRGGGGVDIELLEQYGAVLVSPIVDMQRYFDYHHSPNDTFEQVNLRELQLGSASMAALIYLIDKFDL